MEKQTVDISDFRLKLVKLLRELAGHCQLLALQEALKHHVNCKVDVIRPYVVSKMHPGIGLAHSKDTLDVTDSDRDSANHRRLGPNLSIKVCNFVSVNFVELWVTMPLCIYNVLLE